MIHRGTTLVFLVATLGGCCASHRDVATLERYGGHFIPTAEGPFVNCPPVDRIWFDDKMVTDATLAELAPIISALRPRALNLEFQPITDASLPTLEQFKRDGVEFITLPLTFPPAAARRLKQITYFQERSSQPSRTAIGHVSPDRDYEVREFLWNNGIECDMEGSVAYLVFVSPQDADRAASLMKNAGLLVRARR